MKKLILHFAICIFIVFLFQPANAFPAEKIELTLKEAIKTALSENLDLVTERYNPKIQEAGVTVEEGQFDPNLGMSLNEAFSKSQAVTTLAGTEDRTLTFDISLGQKLKTGTTYELKWSNIRTRGNSSFLRINPYYISEAVLSVTQPLLKDFGMEVQEGRINIAKNSLDSARLGLDAKSMEIIANVEKAYWDLVLAYEEFEVSKLSLSLAQRLLKESRARVEAGVLAPVEVLQAEAEVASREEALLSAQKAIRDFEDKLKAAMNYKDWEIEISPVDRPGRPGTVPAISDVMQEALKNRQDYQQAKLDIKSKEISKRITENQTLPGLSFVGAVGLNGLDGTYGNSLDRLSSGNYYSWQLGLELKIPLGNRTARGNAIKARLEEDKAKTGLQVIEQKMTLEVREAVRTLELSIKKIDATLKTRELAHKRLEAEEEKFRVGMSTAYDVLVFQESYAKALNNEKRALMDYAKAEVELKKVKGTLTVEE
ncbi:MAG: TolC family protein [Nitrospirae bacterium]|nr:TolC family protein [Nitrospirota bacterium]